MKLVKGTLFLIFAGFFFVACSFLTEAQVREKTKTVLETPVPVIQVVPPSPTQARVFTLPTETASIPLSLTATHDPGGEDLPDYYGGLVVTLDYVGQTIQMTPGHGFLLRLGSDFDWTVEIDPPGLVTLNQKITNGPGEQGVYIARQKGEARLLATGSPACLKSNPPCLRPSVLFQITLDIH